MNVVTWFCKTNLTTVRFVFQAILRIYHDKLLFPTGFFLAVISFIVNINKTVKLKRVCPTNWTLYRRGIEGFYRKHLGFNALLCFLGGNVTRSPSITQPYNKPYLLSYDSSIKLAPIWLG